MFHLTTPRHFLHSVVEFHYAGTIIPVIQPEAHLQAIWAEQFEEKHNTDEHPASQHGSR
jgi:hypothetical protein